MDKLYTDNQKVQENIHTKRINTRPPGEHHHITGSKLLDDQLFSHILHGARFNNLYIQEGKQRTTHFSDVYQLKGTGTKVTIANAAPHQSTHLPFQWHTEADYLTHVQGII